MRLIPSNLTGVVLCAALLLGHRGFSGARDIPPTLGPYINPNPADFAEATSFLASDRIVGTYFFYWYDEQSKAHLVDGDGTDALTTHPPTLAGLSWKSIAWHKRQLEDMTAAGIDIVLPVFWGAPSEQDPAAGLHWSYEGLPPLVKAREELVQAGQRPPRIGLFYDTSTLQYNAWGEHQDLTTERGRLWFYATIRDFFSLIPPKHWAMIEGRPIVLLYSAAFARKHDQGVVEYLAAHFPKEFGGRRPWLAREVSWNIQADSVVAWGGALGLKNPGGIASVGPGYDHSAVPGRSRLVADRRDGAFYSEQWLKLLRRPVNFVMIETWNEWHEGTDVAESKEYGRQYIELTRKYVDLFKQKWQPPWPEGPYAAARSVGIKLGAVNQEKGLRHVENDDGLTAPGVFGGHAGRAIRNSQAKGRYIYFSVDDSFKSPGAASFKLNARYYDAAPGRFTVEYDGSDPKAPFDGAYTRTAKSVELTGAKTWKTAEFPLEGARFLNGQNQGSDFRLVIEAPEFAVEQLTLSR